MLNASILSGILARINYKYCYTHYADKLKLSKISNLFNVTKISDMNKHRSTSLCWSNCNDKNRMKKCSCSKIHPFKVASIPFIARFLLHALNSPLDTKHLALMRSALMTIIFFIRMTYTYTPQKTYNC